TRLTLYTGCAANCFLFCIQSASSVDPGELCMLPLDHGSCFGMLLMYYYNAEEGNCRTFHYTGCQGNGNRFGTREECQKTCMGIKVRTICDY
uniref:BPTI/Kunitz inhibitor domain-containing protein n=1 Tax=Myripristis murdjan TaxID=586833 RepID=A0A668AT96_9TELE